MSQIIEETPAINSLMATLGDGEVLALDAEAGRATMAFTVKPEFCHSGYICQGGFVAGWLDSAMAHAAMGMANYEASPATLEIKVTYLKAAIKGSRLKVEAWVEKMGKQVAFLEGLVINEKGETVAKATSTVQMMKLKTAEPAKGLGES